MPLLLAGLLLSLPASALDPDAPGTRALRVRAAIESLPTPARAELRRMFLLYRRRIADRLDRGWSSARLDDAVIERAPQPEPPARLLEQTVAARRKELEDLQSRGDEADALVKDIRTKKRELARALSRLSRAQGLCLDWSDDVWFALRSLHLRHWTVADRRRTTRPFHTAAVACSPPQNPAVCLAFDPWSRGQPDVLGLAAWDAQEPGGRIPMDYFLHDLPEQPR